MSIHFILNRVVLEADGPPARPLLDYLREDRGLTAAKPGCREGDCGACAVLLGERRPEGGVRYRLVNSCLMPMAALQGGHVLTVEGLGDVPNIVQRALVEEGGVQCGYCTPGMVMALTNHLLESTALDTEHLLEALDGNLCRCTGYQGIRRAGASLHESLVGLPAEPELRLEALMAAGVLPEWLDEIPGRLAALPPCPEPDEPAEGAPILAGGTDMLVQGRLTGHAWLACSRPELHGIRIRERRVSLGATTTMEEMLESIDLARALPGWHRALGHVASTPVRDRATVGGNLVNASPIGDLSVMLLALDAELVLLHHGWERRLPLTEFFLGYKKLALEPGELVQAVEFDFPAGGLHFEKVAHREHLDIASVNCALSLELDGRRVRKARLAAGGVGPVPLRLRAVEERLDGVELTPGKAREVALEAARSVAPISDLRGSERYKRLLLRQLVLASLMERAPFLDAKAVLEGL